MVHVISREEDYVKVTYTFLLPLHEEELKAFSKNNQFIAALDEVYTHCRRVWKYEDNPSEDRVSLAHEIVRIIADADVLDV